MPQKRKMESEVKLTVSDWAKDIETHLGDADFDTSDGLEKAAQIANEGLVLSYEELVEYFVNTKAETGEEEEQEASNPAMAELMATLQKINEAHEVDRKLLEEELQKHVTEREEFLQAIEKNETMMKTQKQLHDTIRQEIESKNVELATKLNTLERENEQLKLDAEAEHKRTAELVQQHETELQQLRKTVNENKGRLTAKEKEVAERIQAEREAYEKRIQELTQRIAASDERQRKVEAQLADAQEGQRAAEERVTRLALQAKQSTAQQSEKTKRPATATATEETSRVVQPDRRRTQKRGKSLHSTGTPPSKMQRVEVDSEVAKLRQRIKELEGRNGYQMLPRKSFAHVQGGW